MSAVSRTQLRLRRTFDVCLLHARARAPRTRDDFRACRTFGVATYVRRERPETWTGMIDRSPCGTGTSAVMTQVCTCMRLSYARVVSLCRLWLEGLARQSTHLTFARTTGRARCGPRGSFDCTRNSFTRASWGHSLLGAWRFVAAAVALCSVLGIASRRVVSCRAR